MEGVPVEGLDPFNIFRGHIAVDDLGVRDGQECIGLCSFEGGMCDWNNAGTDDFDWKLVTTTNHTNLIIIVFLMHSKNFKIECVCIAYYNKKKCASVFSINKVILKKI